ncbi:MAG: hypothetical protein IPK39_11965 [Sulfuritalea sp.]|nr:hypothetical protein [Sulfuritalea sp.]
MGTLLLGQHGAQPASGQPAQHSAHCHLPIFLVIYLLRRRIGARWLATILLVALYLAGAFGYLFTVSQATRRPFTWHCALSPLPFYGPRGGLIAAIGSGAVIVATATLVIAGHLVFSYDVTAFISSPSVGLRH